MVIWSNGRGSLILRVKLRSSAVGTGAGLTGLTHESAGLIIATIADVEATTTRYRASSSEIETITTLGTYEAPTSGKCRFKEVDATNHPGLYEIHLADARLAVSNAKEAIVSLSGAANLVETDLRIALAKLDVHDAVRAGLTALPNANADAAGGLPISDAGALDLDTLLARLDEAVSAAKTLTAAYDAAKTAASQTSVDDLPTNSELATALAAADDAVLAAIAALSIPTAAQNAAALMDLTNGVETDLTPRQALRLMTAALTGKLSGAGTTTVVIRNVGDTKARITATVDEDGNRSAVTTDAT